MSKPETLLCNKKQLNRSAILYPTPKNLHGVLIFNNDGMTQKTIKICWANEARSNILLSSQWLMIFEPMLLFRDALLALVLCYTSSQREA